MSYETGVDAGVRNIGRFWLAAIPAVLGIAASIWLGVWIGAHDFRHQLSQEERAADYVGAQELPKGKIAITVLDKSCVRIRKADIDGDSLIVYVKNDCRRNLDYIEIHWQQIAPDSTILGGGYDNGIDCEMPKAASAASECRFHLREVDDRTVAISLWTKTNVW